MNEAVLERIEKDRLEQMSKDEIEYEAEMEAQNLKSQFIDNNDMEALKVIDERLRIGKENIVLLEMVRLPKSQRLVPYNTEIADLSREAGYLERIRAYLHDLFINLESVDRILAHTDKEIKDCNDRVKILEWEKEQIISGVENGCC